MTALNVLAVAAVSAALGGALVASWHDCDRLIVSLLRADEINRECEVCE